MSIDADPAEDRHSRMLAELAAMTLRMARDLEVRQQEAQTAQDAARLAAAFQRVSRSLRQTLALELKVIRFKDDQAREAAVRAAEVEAKAAAAHAEAHAPGGAVWKRKEAVASQVERVIFDEYEPRDWAAFDGPNADEERRRAFEIEHTHSLFSGWLQDAAERPDFTTADLDELIIEGCEACGVDPGQLYEFVEVATPEAPPADEDSS